MSPAIEVALPEWPPPRLGELRERWAAKADWFSVRPDTYFTLGPDGLPVERPTHPEAERWDLHFSRHEADGPAEVTVYVKPAQFPRPEFEHGVGWPMRGEFTALAWKSAADLPGALRAVVDLALDAARTLGGVIGVDRLETPSEGGIGRYYEVEDDAWADAEWFEYLAARPGFDVSGWGAPAV